METTIPSIKSITVKTNKFSKDDSKDTKNTEDTFGAVMTQATMQNQAPVQNNQPKETTQSGNDEETKIVVSDSSSSSGNKLQSAVKSASGKDTDKIDADELKKLLSGNTEVSKIIKELMSKSESVNDILNELICSVSAQGIDTKSIADLLSKLQSGNSSEGVPDILSKLTSSQKDTLKEVTELIQKLAKAIESTGETSKTSNSTDDFIKLLTESDQTAKSSENKEAVNKNTVTIEKLVNTIFGKNDSKESQKASIMDNNQLTAVTIGTDNKKESLDDIVKSLLEKVSQESSGTKEAAVSASKTDKTVIKTPLADVKDDKGTTKSDTKAVSLDVKDAAKSGETIVKAKSSNSADTKGKDSLAGFTGKSDEETSHGNSSEKADFKTVMSTQTNLNKVSANSTVKADNVTFANVTRPEDLVDITVNRFKSMKLPEITELKVKLRPEDMGEITVKVVLEKGQVNGSIHATKNEVVTAIQSQMDNLKQELKSNNVNLNHLSVNVGTGDNYENQGRRNFDQNSNSRHSSYSDIMDDTIEEVNEEKGFTIMA